MKPFAAISIAVLLAGAVGLVAPLWHLPALLGAALLVRLVERDAFSKLGPWTRWAAVLLVLGFVGAWLGPHDRTVAGFGVSATGALAAGTMMARSLVILLATSSLVALASRARLRERLATTRLARLAEVVTVALSLVPSIATALRARGTRLRDTRPTLRTTEAFGLGVAVVLEATETAHRIAQSWDEAKATPRDAVPPSGAAERDDG